MSKMQVNDLPKFTVSQWEGIQVPCALTVEAYFYDFVLFLIIKLMFRFNLLVKLESDLTILFIYKIVKIY